MPEGALQGLFIRPLISFMRALHLVYNSRLLNRTRNSHSSYACHLALYYGNEPSISAALRTNRLKNAVKTWPLGKKQLFTIQFCIYITMTNVIPKASTSHEPWWRSSDRYSRILFHWHKMLITSCFHQFLALISDS